MTNPQYPERKRLDLAEMRQKLAGKTGKTYWRSLSELAESDDFEEVIRHEFPRQAGLLDSLNRRDFLKVLGASLALAGMTACVPQGPDKILPYVNPPEELVPAKYLYYASAMVQDGYAKGVLLSTTMGRPIKVEGNPKHPDSLGASDVFMQASILELYDPERAKQVTKGGAPSTWSDFLAAAPALMSGNVRILSGLVTSPTLIAQMQDLMKANANVTWTQYSPAGRGNSTLGAQQVFGEAYDPVYNFANADVILSLDCDFLFTEPGHLRYSRDFAQRHQPISTQGTMNRLYVVEGSSTLTGSNADHRLAVKPSQVAAFAQAVASRLGVAGATAPSGELPGQDWLDPLVADLKKAGPAALVVAGDRQPPEVHALAYAMNQALGSIGNTLTMVGPNLFNPANPQQSMAALVKDLNGGGVDTLVILEGNPVYTAPADLDFAAAMKKAKNSVYLAYYPDETAAQSTWVIPAAHYMESWGDARAYDGTVSIVQPVIQPLYGGKSMVELVAGLQGQGDVKGYDLVRKYWSAQQTGGNFEHDWKDILSQGVVPNTGLQAASLTASGSVPAAPAATSAAPGGLEIVFEPDYSLWDGRFSNLAWLQELPKPITRLSWNNAALISPATAARLGLETDDVVTLKLRGRSLEAPIFVQPGQPDDVLVVTLGYGRTAGGTVQEGVGYNAYALRTSEAPWFDSGLDVAATGKKVNLVTTQHHWTMENRELVREATLDEYQQNPHFAQHLGAETPSLYGQYEYNGYAWGMSINLNTCIGCNACVVACQAENNIPTVGREQVANGREMLWLRVDAYFEGSPEHPNFVYQPVPCMHCEKAPCEVVCPVEATSHSEEGLNEMTYNRCVGTRYCSNNCPYKVRRFNFFHYTDDSVLPLRAMRNPNVTVRMRGVMEKCTYCVQRISLARAETEIAGRPIKDSDLQTACQQACPTQAIIFGNINDESAEVRKLKEMPLNYALLDELGTQPRTTYLAKVRNPNPAIPERA